MADALDVRCPSCGGTCHGGDVDRVRCPFCGADVVVPEQVRFYANCIAVLEHAGEWRAERIAQLRALREGKPVPEGNVPYARLPRGDVEAKCPSCGCSITYGDKPIERCPQCGDESVPKQIDAIHGFVRILGTGRLSFNELDAEIAKLYPIAKAPESEGGTWRCGVCNAELQQIGVDPLAFPKFAPCASCGTRNQPNIAHSTLLAYRAIDAALDRQERAKALAEVEADLAAHRPEPEPESLPKPAPKSSGSGCGGLLVLVPLALVFIWLVRPSHAVAPRPQPLPIAPIRQLPQLIPKQPELQDECRRLRASGGECVSNTMFRSCDDAGVIHEERCGLGVPPCPHECGSDARYEPVGSKDGG
jgi:hypothetical protein